MRDVEAKVIAHPYQAAMTEAERERAIADTPEAIGMVAAIMTAVRAYMDYLDKHDMFFQDDPDYPDHDPVTVSEALVVTAHPLFGIDISLKNGPLQRVYGLGVDPDPDGRNPAAPRSPATRQRDPLDLT